jgi:8-oxo-dGTP pyrophosphatase MutT (NUDIX family)
VTQPATGGYDVERTSVRVVLRDEDGAVLLFRTVDPVMPETGTWWELPGGGVEPGESTAETAVREVREETGFVLAPDDVSPPSWSRDATYLRRRRRYLQHEVVVHASVPGRAPEPSTEGRTEVELLEYVGHRWWTVAEIRESRERFFPGRLPELVDAFLAGEQIDEPFDQWN